MRIESLGFALVLSSLISGAAVANPAGKAKKSDPNTDTVCKTQSFVGSRIPERICKTRGEWDQGRKDAQEIVETKARSLEFRPSAPPPIS